MRSLLVLLILVSSPAFAAKKTPAKGGAEVKNTAAAKPKPTKSANDVSAQIANTELKRDYKKGDRFIRAVVEAHEAAFPGALKAHSFLQYPTELSRLSRIQQALVGTFLERPDFQKQLLLREPLTSLRVTVVKGAEEKKPTAQKYNAGNWREFKETLSYALDNAVGELQDRKKEATPQEVVKYLAAQALRAGLDSGIPENNEVVIMSTTDYVFIGSIVKNNPKITLSELMEQVKRLDIGALDYLKDAKNYGPLFAGFKGRSYGEDDLSKLDVWSAVLTRIHKEISRELYGNRPFKLSLALGDAVTIHEVHPNIAIFRGFVGNDCSTSFSPGFVFTPYDRYYYVFDSGGNVLGYAGLSIVSTKAGKTLFLHTIQGPAFTSEQAQLVMLGFQKVAKETFGAEMVLLARDENIHENVNFEQIRAAMMAAVKGKPQVPVTWLDKDYRATIADWDSTMTYDDPNNNRKGRRLELDTSVVNVEVARKAFEPKFTKPLKTPAQIRDEEEREYCRQSLMSSRRSGPSSSYYGRMSDWD